MAQKAGIDTAVCAAIVGFADLTLGDKAGEVIDTHKQICKGRLRGIRSSVSRDPHFPEGIVIKPAKDRLLFDPEYRKGLVQIAESDLCYEAMLYHCQIKELAACARALPDLPIILDHIGCIIGVGPYRGNERETFKIWRNDMKELSGCDNVMVKLGGFGMIICGPTWHERDYPPTSEELAKAWRPYVETCIEFFGAERCMFESNFPVDKAMYSYPVLWNAFKRLSSGYSEAERGALFYNTAARVYRI
jgi:predicted TIM-barrel fold metal-dependent hydrolase